MTDTHPWSTGWIISRNPPHEPLQVKPDETIQYRFDKRTHRVHYSKDTETETHVTISIEPKETPE